MDLLVQVFDMSGKLLFMIISGPESPNKVRWGLRMALNTYTHPYGEKLLDDVKVLLFCGGVSIVDPEASHYEDFKERLLDLEKAGVETASCVSRARAPCSLQGLSYIVPAASSPLSVPGFFLCISESAYSRWQRYSLLML